MANRASAVKLDPSNRPSRMVSVPGPGAASPLAKGGEDSVWARASRTTVTSASSVVSRAPSKAVAVTTDGSEEVGRPARSPPRTRALRALEREANWFLSVAAALICASSVTSRRVNRASLPANCASTRLAVSWAMSRPLPEPEPSEETMDCMIGMTTGGPPD